MFWTCFFSTRTLVNLANPPVRRRPYWPSNVPRLGPGLASFRACKKPLLFPDLLASFSLPGGSGLSWQDGGTFLVVSLSTESELGSWGSEWGCGIQGMELDTCCLSPLPCITLNFFQTEWT